MSDTAYFDSNIESEKIETEKEKVLTLRDKIRSRELVLKTIALYTLVVLLLLSGAWIKTMFGQMQKMSNLNQSMTASMKEMDTRITQMQDALIEKDKMIVDVKSQLAITQSALYTEKSKGCWDKLEESVAFQKTAEVSKDAAESVKAAANSTVQYVGGLYDRVFH